MVYVVKPGQRGTQLIAFSCKDISTLHNHQLIHIFASLWQVPRDEDGEPTFDELICQSCVRRCSFLEEYPELIASPVEVEDDEAPPSQDSEAPKVADVSTAEAPPTQTSVNKKPYTNGLTLETALGGRPVPSVEENGKAEKLEVSSTNHVGESSGSGGSVCKLKRTSQAESALTTSEEKPEETTSVGLKVLDSGRAVFLAKSWRTELCQCDACKAMYMAKGIEFLLDKEDTLQEYEESAKRKREEAKEKEDGTTQAFLQKLGHVQRIELVHGINNLATELESFLVGFFPSVDSRFVRNVFSRCCHVRAVYPSSCDFLQWWQPSTSYRRLYIDSHFIFLVWCGYCKLITNLGSFELHYAATPNAVLLFCVSFTSSDNIVMFLYSPWWYPDVRHASHVWTWAPNRCMKWCTRTRDGMKSTMMHELVSLYPELRDEWEHATNVLILFCNRPLLGKVGKLWPVTIYMSSSMDCARRGEWIRCLELQRAIMSAL